MRTCLIFVAGIVSGGAATGEQCQVCRMVEQCFDGIIGAPNGGDYA